MVALGGAAGAVARYAVMVSFETFWKRPFPLATLVVNVSGSFVLGLFITLAAERFQVDPVWRLLIATGFVGAYTTFSTFEYETQRLSELGFLGWGLLNVLTSVVAGYAAVVAGVFLARRW
jgi:CrcB protein